MPTTYETRESEIQKLSGGRGYSFLTSAQKDLVNAPNLGVNPNVSGLGGNFGTAEYPTYQSGNGAKAVGEMYQKTNSLTPAPTTPVTPTPKPETDIVADTLAKEEMSLPERQKLELQQRADKRTRETKDFIASLGAQLESSKAAMLTGIGESYNRIIQQTEEKNKKYEATIGTSLIRSGGGVGGQQRYSPEISSGIYQAAVNEGLQRVADIIGKRNEAIASVNASYSEKKFALMSEEFDRLNKINDDLDKTLSEIAKTQREKAEKLNTQLIQSSRDDAVASLISQGITDPVQLLDYLNYDDRGKKTGDFTAKEVSDSLKNLYTTQENKFLSITDAQSLGVPYGTTERQAAEMGIIPKGKPAEQYDIRSVGGDIVRIDKNNPDDVKVIFKGKEGEDPFTTQQKFQNTFGYAKEVTDNSKDYILVRDAYGRIKASAKDPSAAGDLALIFNYMKTLDPGSTVREGEFATAQNSAGIPERIRSQYNKVTTGERLSEKTRNDFVDRADKLYSAQLESQILFQSQSRDVAEQLGLNPDQAVPDLSQLKQKLTPQKKPNEIIVWNREMQEAGFIPIEEFDPTLYIKF